MVVHASHAKNEGLGLHRRDSAESRLPAIGQAGWTVVEDRRQFVFGQASAKALRLKRRRMWRSVAASLAAIGVLAGCGTSGSSRGETGGTSSVIGGGGGTGNATASGGTASGGLGGSSVGVGGSDAGVCSPPAAGGFGGVPTACASVAALTADQSLIADFECLPADGSVSYITGADGSPLNGYPHGGYVYANDTDTATCLPIAGVTVNANGVDGPGHDSDHALHLNMAKPPNNWGGGLGVWLGACVDASAFGGITFWAKGTTTQNSVNLTLRTFETATPPQGTCVEADCQSFSTTITLSPDWQHYTFAWSDFTPPTSPAGVTLDGSQLLDIGFYVSTWSEDETIDFWLDDLEFAGGSGSQLPRDCLTGADAGP